MLTQRHPIRPHPLEQAAEREEHFLKLSIGLLAIAAAVFSLATNTKADTFEADTGASACASGNCNQNPNTGSTLSTSSAAIDNTGGTAQAGASAALGNLQVSAQALVSDAAFMSATASAEAAFSDTLTATGTAGTVAEFLISVEFDPEIHAGTNGGTASLTANLAANGLSEDYSSLAGTPLAPITVSVLVGVPFGLSGALKCLQGRSEVDLAAAQSSIFTGVVRACGLYDGDQLIDPRRQTTSKSSEYLHQSTL